MAIPNNIINVFRLGPHNNTTSLIYTRDANGIFYFALARKLGVGARQRQSPNKNSGPAGTDIKYAGKYGFFGGKKNKKYRVPKHDLEASISEIRDEANLPNLIHTNVFIDWIPSINYTPQCFKLEKAWEINSNVVGFVYYIEDYNHFFNLFPPYPATRSGPDIVTSSCGEIDQVSSFTMAQIMELQEIEVNNNNNFIIGYCIETFNTHIIPFISTKSNEFRKKWNKSIPMVVDTTPFIVHNTPIYIEIQKGIYN